MTESTPEAATPDLSEATPKRVRAPKPEAQSPSVGRVVHYQEGQNPPLAALITAVYEEAEVSLVVYREHLHMFRQGVEFSATPQSGHWNWPPRA